MMWVITYDQDKHTSEFMPSLLLIDKIKYLVR